MDGSLLPVHAGDGSNSVDYDPIYEEIAYKFVQHFLWISYAMDRMGVHHDEMWDEQDGFFYDVLRLPTARLLV